MDTLLEIQYKNGRERIIDLQTFVSSEPFGANLATEIDIRFDLIEEGLFMEIAHHAPETTDADGPPKRRAAFDDPAAGETRFEGAKSHLRSDNYVKLLDPSDFADVSLITRADKPKIMSVAGEIVVLARITALSSLYLSEERDMAMMSVIAQLADILDAQLLLDGAHGEEPVEVSLYKRDQALALEIGVSVGLLRQARLFAEEFAREKDGADA